MWVKERMLTQLQLGTYTRECCHSLVGSVADARKQCGYMGSCTVPHFCIFAFMMLYADAIHRCYTRMLYQGRKTFGNLEPGSPNAIFEFQEFEMQFLEAFFLFGAIKMK